MTEADHAFAMRLLALDEFAAAETLLKSGLAADGSYIDLYGSDSTFSNSQSSAVIIPVAKAATSSFANVVCISLPDNCPGQSGKRPKATHVHQFAVTHARAIELNAQLRHDAVKRSQGDTDGQVVSNVGGYHSKCEALRPEHHAAWYGPIATLLVEALHTLHADGKVDGTPIEELDFAGWLNVSSRPSHFNRPHDHGKVPYSAVYFVDDGGPPGQPLPYGWSCGAAPADGRPFFYNSAQKLSQWQPPHPASHGEETPLLARCAGQLLLQTQLEAWSNDFAVLSIPCVPGTLYLFPGYVPHAVLPRTLQSFERTDGGAVDRSAVAHAQALRVSVACNISAAAMAGASPESKVSGGAGGDLPTVWLASRGI